MTDTLSLMMVLGGLYMWLTEGATNMPLNGIALTGQYGLLNFGRGFSM